MSVFFFFSLKKKNISDIFDLAPSAGSTVAAARAVILDRTLGGSFHCSLDVLCRRDASADISVNILCYDSLLKRGP